MCDKLLYKVFHELCDNLFDQLCDELCYKVFDQLCDELCYKVFDQLCDELCDEFFDQLYIYLLKTELRISDSRHFHWLAGHRLSAHIPALPNMVNKSINEESWIKIILRNWRPLKIV